MLERPLVLRVPVRGLIQKGELTLYGSEWQMIEHLTNVLAPIKAISEILCGSKYPTMGLV